LREAGKGSRVRLINWLNLSGAFIAMSPEDVKNSSGEQSIATREQGGRHDTRDDPLTFTLTGMGTASLALLPPV
jgi:hypothetical protein